MNINSKYLVMLIPFFCFIALNLYAEIELPFLISNGMVVQRQEPIPLWGWCEANTDIKLEFDGEARSVRSDENGAWRAVFSAREAGGPHELRISSSKHSISVRDILVGDVWLCSGQSNMEWVLRNTENADEEVANSENSHIRHFRVPHTWALAPSKRLAGGIWTSANPNTSGEFTAVGYYFAKMINSITGIPVGLLHSSWGGSNIESWMSPTSLGETDEAALERMQGLVKDAERRAESMKNELSRWPNAVVSHFDAANADWSAPSIDESDWLEVSVPQLWETQGFAGMDGVVWYRKTFVLNDRQSAGGIVLGLARIDDSDTTWINGHKIGETNAYDEVRRYDVPAKFLKPGENQIAVRVEDTGGGGGIYSDADLLYVELSDGERYSLAGSWKIKADKVTLSMMTDVNHTPTALYNKMLHPLFAAPIKGMLWYQGESNADTVEEALNYREQFQNLIKDWRRSWSKPELAFYWVQLANFNTYRDTETSSPWAIVRDAQTAALELPNTGQAIIIDVGDPNDIHPRNKKTVGSRLALIALNKTYGKSDVRYSGPVLDNYKVEGTTVRLSFSHLASKLAVRDGGNSVSGFEIAGADGFFRPATAIIQNNEVVISNESVKRPVAVRYAWKDNPEEANLVGDSNLPAGPFKLTIAQ